MCNQRERLIGYVYNEGEASELREVQEHVDGCAECRAEITALRSVREDLLAWDVPPSESVWRPFVAAPVAQPVWWRQVPAWAMAAAASVMLVGGFAGGAVAHGFSSESTTGLSSQTAVATSVAAPVSLTAADLSAIERKLRAELQTAIAGVDARIVRVSADPSRQDDHAKLTAEIASLRELNARLVDIVNSFDARWESVFRSVATNNAAVNAKVKDLHQAVSAIAGSTSK